MSYIHPIKESDFELSSKDGLVLKYDDVIILLFNDGSELGLEMKKMIKQTLKTVVGPVFAECDLHAQDKVATTILRIGNIPSHPLSWMMQPFPYIAVYRGGWPQAFYNGELDVQKFSEYSSILAGQPTYRETKYVSRKPSSNTEKQGNPQGRGQESRVESRVEPNRENPANPQRPANRQTGPYMQSSSGVRRVSPT